MTGTSENASAPAARDTKADTPPNPLTELAHSEAADRLKAELQEFLAAQTQRVLAGVGRKLGETTLRLNDIADGKSPGLGRLALDTGRKVAGGKGPLRSVVESGASHAKDSVVGAFKGLTGKDGQGGGKGGKKNSGNKPTVIIEHIDVPVPLRTAYDQWTQYQDFSTFAKGVKSARRDDDTHSDWQAKVWWSNRSWKATTTEQVPDDRIAWSSEGAKGTTTGVVSFHRITESLTRVVLVVEYYPSGFFEKTGNIWRAQGRRMRLDLKNFVRFITLKGEAEDGWRGEIRDAEVVREHEDAVAEEEEEARAAGADEDGPAADGEAADDEPGDAYDEDRDDEADQEDQEDREDREDGEADGDDFDDEYDDEADGEYDDEEDVDDEAGETYASEDEYAEDGGRR